MFGIKELDVNALQNHFNEGKKIRLLDVRSMGEIAQGVIPNAEAFPLNALPARLNEIDAEEITVLYCRSGARSGQGVGFMTQQGFDNVYNLRGGVMAWAQNGMPIVPFEAAAAL